MVVRSGLQRFESASVRSDLNRAISNLRCCFAPPSRAKSSQSILVNFSQFSLAFSQFLVDFPSIFQSISVDFSRSQSILVDFLVSFNQVTQDKNAGMFDRQEGGGETTPNESQPPVIRFASGSWFESRAPRHLRSWGFLGNHSRGHPAIPNASKVEWVLGANLAILLLPAVKCNWAPLPHSQLSELFSTACILGCIVKASGFTRGVCKHRGFY